MRLASLFVTGPLGRAVLLLGITQIIGYGTLFYAFPILAPAISVELDITLPTFYAVFSLALLAGGLTAPRLGRLMDVHGAQRLMMMGSGLIATLLMCLAMSPNLTVFGVAIVLLEVISFMVLYDAAFATLAQLGSGRARRAITFLTLIAGFASTVFWPLTGWLVSAMGWRWTIGVYALLHLGVALPLHFQLSGIKPQGDEDPFTSEVEAEAEGKKPSFAPIRQNSIPFTFLSISISFALTAVVLSALSVQMVPVLQTLGLSAAAYMVAMAMGPAQVIVRITDAVFWQNLHPLDVALISAMAIPLAIFMLFLPASAITTGTAFAICFGAGQGLSSIVRGSVPLTLFGASGFGARLGQMAFVRIILSAGAPFAFATLMAKFGTHTALGVMAAVGIIALIPLVVLRLRLSQIITSDENKQVDIHVRIS